MLKFSEISRYSIGLFALLWLELSPPCVASAHDILVCSYFTPEGVKVAAPTRDCPAFYSLESTPVRNWAEPEPLSRESVRRLFSNALTVNSYLPAETLQPQTLLIVYHWGVASPIIFDEATAAEHFLNRIEMLALICGRSWELLTDRDKTAVRIAAREERYFVLVSAYRADDWLRQKKRTLLWRIHTSVPIAHLSLRSATPILLAAGSSMMGRDSLGVRSVRIDVKGVLQRDPDNQW